MWREFSQWFWSPYVWLPKGFKWEDMVSNEEVNFPIWMDLWTYPFLFAFFAIILRFQILNKFVYSPIANLIGLKDFNAKPVVPNVILEEMFNNYKSKPPSSVLLACAKKLDISPRRVERWLRHRVLMTKLSKHKKFSECAWQFTYYLTMFSYGMYVMIQKPWLYDLNKCWYNYPYHNLDNDVWWYYILSLSFYWSMIFIHFIETKRKDFWQMFFHHLVTIALITFSWTCNFTRVGTLVLILHDCADIPLQLAKMCIYLGHKALCDAVFALFAFTWVLTRDCIFPLWIVRNTLFEATEIIPLFPAYYIFNTLLVVLQFLHIFWTYFILKIISNSLIGGNKTHDERSSTDEDEFLTDREKKGKENGLSEKYQSLNGANQVGVSQSSDV